MSEGNNSITSISLRSDSSLAHQPMHPTRFFLAALVEALASNADRTSSPVQPTSFTRLKDELEHIKAAASKRAKTGGLNSGKVRGAEADKRWRNDAKSLSVQFQKADPTVSVKRIASNI